MWWHDRAKARLEVEKYWVGSKTMEITSLAAKGRQVKSTAGEQSKVKASFDILFFKN